MKRNILLIFLSMTLLLWIANTAIVPSSQPQFVAIVRLQSQGAKAIVNVEDQGRSPLAANTNTASKWQYYQFLFNNEDKTFSFRSVATNKFITADLLQGQRLIARSDYIDKWQKFKIVSKAGRKFGLIALANNKYVTVDKNQGFVLYANKDNYEGEWEAFTFA